MFPIFEQDNSESTTQLIKKFFAGGKLLVSDRLIQIVGEIKNDSFVKSPKTPFPSFRRKPESSHFNSFWTPAFAGVTEMGLFTTPSNKKGQPVSNMVALFLMY